MEKRSAPCCRKVRRKRFDATLMLGDLVGYGAEPNQVVESLRDMPGRLHAIRGNHDKVVAELEDGETFNSAALHAARWTTAKLSGRNLTTVRDLPVGPLSITPDLSICHGSPLDEDQYLFSEFDAYNVFETHTVPVTFFGHTHLPSVFIFALGRCQGHPAWRQQGANSDSTGFSLSDQSRVDRTAQRPQSVWRPT